MDLSVLHSVSYGMYVLSAFDGSRHVGCVINTCMQVTNEPVSIAVSVNKGNYTYQAMQKTGRFAVSILSESISPNVISRFGFCSSLDNDKFLDIDYEEVDGLNVLNFGCCGNLICKVKGQIDCGTHVVFLADVLNAIRRDAPDPMTYAYYHKVIKGKAPKAAPTYSAGEEDEAPADLGVRYVCTLCRYIYEGDITKEPDDYVCPICKAPKSKFEL